MDQSSGNKKYSAKDIERYHAGEMSPAEMHALEKAAMNDPFLADALEGYVFTSNAQGDLENIKKRLAEKSQNKKIVPLFSQTWFRVAAVVMVLGVSGWLLFSNKKQENQFANSTAEKILQKDTQDVAKGKVSPLIDSPPLTDSSSNFIMPNEEITVSSAPVRKNSGKQLTPPGAVKSENNGCKNSWVSLNPKHLLHIIEPGRLLNNPL